MTQSEREDAVRYIESLITDISRLVTESDYEWAYYRCQDLMSELTTLQRKVDDAKQKTN
jgi:hypothetical protein